MVKRSLRCFLNLVCGPAWHRPMSGRRWGGSTRKSIGARGAGFSARIKKPDIRQQLWLLHPIQSACCNRAGSIYVHTWPKADISPFAGTALVTVLGGLAEFECIW